jgi:ABC-type uncharacterized transport system permease subunit
MTRTRPMHLKAYARALVALALIIVWGSVAFSGMLLWLAPSGPRSGWHELFLGSTKHPWKVLHVWLSMAALGVTMVHVVIDWRAWRGVMRHFTRVHRGPLAGV